MFPLDFKNPDHPNLQSPESLLLYLGAKAIQGALPEESVGKFLTVQNLHGNIVLLSIGKAAYRMAMVAFEVLKNQITTGLIVTKYGHAGPVPQPIKCIEAGHPIPDQNSILAGKKILELCSRLKPEDTLLLLLSGGGSSLAEVPAEGLELKDLIFWNQKLLASGADIQEINTVRILLSSIKGGKLLSKIEPAKSMSLILSDVIGDELSKVASGPTIHSTIKNDSIFKIFKQYNLIINKNIGILLKQNENSPRTPADSKLHTTFCIGNIASALKTVQEECQAFDIETILLTSSLGCEAREAGFFLGAIAREYSRKANHPILILCGGETTVTHEGNGKGGRNQELALAFAKQVRGLQGVTLFSLATDGTDGPTDTAGAIVNGNTWDMIQKHTNADLALKNHQSYEVLKLAEALVFTGPTGTNVNDIQFLWIESGSIEESQSP
ncbi:glycerate kinase [Leptospira sp. WS92.C1]